MTRIRLTKGFVEKAPPPVDKDQIFYRDDELKGFALRVTANGVKSFVVEKNIGNKVRRMTLGKYGALTTEQARNEAKKIMGQIATGIDPIARRQASKIHALTLHEVFEDYLKARKNLKHNTLYNYKRVLTVAFDDWASKPLAAITKDKVTKLHESLGQERGAAYANLAMRLLRALFNFAEGQYEDAEGKAFITENPVKRLSQTRAWYRVERRQTYIKSHELAPWYTGVQQLQNDVLRDYLLLIIFTGLRRQEAATLRWDQVDLQAKTLTVLNTKNHESHTLPLTHYLYELLIRRQQNKINPYVFPGTGKEGYIIEPRKQMTHVTRVSGIHFTVHDLRRTFLTIAEGLDIPAYALKRLMNHKMTHDITASYIVTDVERLRKPMQQITDYMLKCMGAIAPTAIVSIQPATQGAVHAKRTQENQRSI